MDRKGHRGRLVGAVGGEAVIEALVSLPARDLQSLLMHVFAERAERVGPGDILVQVARGGLFAPGFVDPREAHGLAQAAFEVADRFEAVELSPVVPLGAARLLAGVHSNNVLATTRGAELVSDPTIALALLAARRRRDPAARSQPLRLCALNRVTRMQPVPMKSLLPHFRLFALVTAGQRGDEDQMLREQIEVHLRLFRLLDRRGYRFEEILIDVSHTGAVEHRLGAGAREAVRREVRTHQGIDADELAARYGLAPLRGDAGEVLAAARLPPALHARLERIAAEVLAPLAASYPEARLRFDLTRLAGLGYYAGPCLRIDARAPDGRRYNVGDGGFLCWTGELLSDRRERLLSTGIGVDLVSALFRGG
jgi:hypothetical protein